MDNNKDINGLTYSDSIAELEAIMNKMQNPDCDIDLLSEYTGRALALLKHCKERLTKADEDVTRCLEELN